jgi:phage baseplate assembly protein W
MESLNKTRVWLDVDSDFTRHPYTNDVGKFINEEAVKQSFFNLLSTKYGERPFQPWIGSGVHEILFENMDESTALLLQYKIEDVINNHEPRMILHEVSAIPNYNANAYEITVGFSVVNQPEPLEITLQLERIR